MNLNRKHSLVVLTLLTILLQLIRASAEVVPAIFNSPNDIPIITNSYTATGNTIVFTLNFTPAPGAELMAIKNTGSNFINGVFDNLAHGQTVSLSYGGITYDFVADYFGGDGNDLTLFWGNLRVFSWGDDSSGQIGQGDYALTEFRRPAPVPVITTNRLTGRFVVAVASGGTHTLALCSNGSLLAWGRNEKGQLGDGTTTSFRTIPTTVVTSNTALAGKLVVAIAAGNAHSLALCSDGSMATWGDNQYYGQLGDGTTTQRNLPVAVVTAGTPLAGKTVIRIAAGQTHNLALCSDGTLVAWGDNHSDKLGTTNLIAASFVPIAVMKENTVLAGRTITDIVATADHNLVLCTDGTIAAWGQNSYGQLGDGTLFGRNLAVKVVTTNTPLSGKSVAAIAGGGRHSLALCTDGTIAAWGYNNNGQLGDGTTISRTNPVAATKLGTALAGKTVKTIGAGYYFSVAGCSDGTLAAWGDNSGGQLGDTTITNRLIPTTVIQTNLTVSENSISAISASGLGYTLVLLTNGNLVAWGQNLGWLGDGTMSTRFRPLPLKNPLEGRTVRSIATGYQHSFCVSPDGMVSAWGNNTHGELGNDTPLIAPGGSFTWQLSPAPIPFVETSINSVLNGKTIRKIAPGYSHNLGLCSDGTLVSWGENVSGELGNGLTGGYSSAPVAVAISNTVLAGKEIAAISAGRNQSLALCSDGTLAVWGFGYSATPTAVTTSNTVLQGRKITAIAAGRYFNLALCSDGTLASWGNNGNGQIGDGTIFTSRPTPVAVITNNTPLAGRTVVAIAVGYYHCLALCSDGLVAAWGSSTHGELGQYSPTNCLLPTAVVTNGTPLAGRQVVAIGAGESFSLALCSDGTLVAWGYNTYGSLGDSSFVDRYLPIVVGLTNLPAGSRIKSIVTGPFSRHSLGLVAIPSSPKIAAYGNLGTFTLVWPTNFIGYILQASTPPADWNNWVDLTNSPIVVGSNYSVTLPVTFPARFFRIRSP